MIWYRVYIDIFLVIFIFSYSLTDTWNLSFGYIKWTLYVAFTVTFLDIVFGRYDRQGMGRKTATKKVEWVRRRQVLLGNIAHCIMSVSWYLTD